MNYRIEIHPRGAPSLVTPTPKNRKKNFLPGAGSREDLGRRRAAAAAISFFDAGNFTNGEILDESLSPEFNLGDSLAYNFDELTAEDRADFVGSIERRIFGSPPENPPWRNRFRRIEKGGNFERAVRLSFNRTDAEIFDGDLSAAAEWAAAGLRLQPTALDTLTIKSSILFDGEIRLSAPGDNYKVTRAASPETPAAEFTPSNDMRIFLMPAIVESYGITNYYSGTVATAQGQTKTVEYLDLLNFNFSVLPRALYDDYLAAQASAAYDYFYRHAQLIKRLPGARARRGVDANSISWTPFPQTNFPFLALYAANGLSEIETGANIRKNRFYEAGVGRNLDFARLVLAVEKADQFFYFWRISA